MQRFYVKLTGMQKYKGAVCTNYQDMLGKFKLRSRNCFCTPAGQRMYEVDFHDTASDVKLADRTCSCRILFIPMSFLCFLFF